MTCNRITSYQEFCVILSISFEKTPLKRLAYVLEYFLYFKQMKQSHRVSYVCNLYLYKFEYCRTKNKQDKTVFQKLKKTFLWALPKFHWLQTRIRQFCYHVHDLSTKFHPNQKKGIRVVESQTDRHEIDILYRHTERQTYRQTNKLTDVQTDKQTDRETRRQRDKQIQTDKDIKIQTQRQTHRQINKLTDIQIEKQTDRETNRQTYRDKPTDRQID